MVKEKELNRIMESDEFMNEDVQCDLSDKTGRGVAATVPNDFNQSLSTLKTLIETTLESITPKNQVRNKAFNNVTDYLQGIIEKSKNVQDSQAPFNLRQNASVNLLTRRERQVLKLIASGFANKNIASQLNISIRTAEAHRANMTKKLAIKTTAGLVKFAISNGLV
ncbi:MAG: hypothetical protein KAR20_18615 [Candidatus Heimdallarchaeota archaeon]|nr:hypothetical protein [Candidatus Heimdallarchaeota archaeon]